MLLNRVISHCEGLLAIQIDWLRGRSFDKELIHLVELLLCDFLNLSLLNFEVSFHRGLRDLLRTETLRIAEGASLSNVG